MGEKINNGAKDKPAASETTNLPGQCEVFDDLVSFSRAIETAAGVTFDLAAVQQLNTDFVEASEKYLLLNVKEYGVENADNMLFLFEDRALVFSGSCPSPAAVKEFGGILAKPFGISTIHSFLVLDMIVDKHKKHLEGFSEKIKKQEEAFDPVENSKLNLEIERFSDRIEEFHDLLLELQERRYKQVQFQYITFDYRVLLAESQSLQGRARRRIETLKRLRQDYGFRSSEELNNRILKLNNVVTRLTAITVIFMVPTLIASHFGMNFAFMPELNLWWTYPAVVAGQIVIIAAGIVIFRKVGWL